MDRFKSPKYIAWVSQLEQTCVMCGHQGWEDNQIIAHHAISIPGLELGGMGTKASDTLAMPMHVTCHQQFHQEFDNWKHYQPIWLMKWQEKVLRTIIKQTQTCSWIVDG